MEAQKDIRYQRGKIYKIVCDTTGLVYYGSTIEPTLARRLTKHVGNLNEFKKGQRNNVTSFQVMENNNYHIVLVESYPCDTRDELLMRERFYIENNECVNKYCPIRTNDERKDIRLLHNQIASKSQRESRAVAKQIRTILKNRDKRILAGTYLDSE